MRELRIGVPVPLNCEEERPSARFAFLFGSVVLYVLYSFAAIIGQSECRDSPQFLTCWYCYCYSGEKKQLEKLVATLGEELAALRDQRDFWQHRAQFLENLMVSLPDPGVDVDLDSALALAVAPLASAPLPAESGLAFCVDVSAFLQAYEKTAAPLLGMHAPPIDRHSFARLERTHPAVRLAA